MTSGCVGKISWWLGYFIVPSVPQMHWGWRHCDQTSRYCHLRDTWINCTKNDDFQYTFFSSIFFSRGFWATGHMKQYHKRSNRPNTNLEQNLLLSEGLLCSVWPRFRNCTEILNFSTKILMASGARMKVSRISEKFWVMYPDDIWKFQCLQDARIALWLLYSKLYLNSRF